MTLPLPFIELLGNDAVASYSTDNGSTWTPFARVMDIDTSKITCPEIKNTNINSTAQTSQPGIPDYGTTKVEIRFQKAVATDLLNFVQTQATNLWSFEADDGSSLVGYGWIKDLGIFSALKLDEIVNTTMEIRNTGPQEFTEGS